MVLGPSSAWLTEQGYLAPARVFAPPIGFSVQGLRKRMGDFDMKQAGEELGGRSIMGDAVSHYRRHLSGQTAIAFCCSVAHAEAVAEAFRGQGVSAASIDGTMDATWRRNLLSRLGSGELKVLTSCSLIGEGVDVPSVAGCILLRPTQSLSLHLQMIGRCLRPQGEKTAVILDHVGNIQRLGHHLDEQEWTLEGVKKKEKKKAPSVKVCPKCFAAMGSQASVCGECGHRFAVERRELQHVDGELQEVSRFRVGDVVVIKGDHHQSFASSWRGEWRIIGILETIAGASLRHEQTGEIATIKQCHLVRAASARKREQGSAQTLEELIQVGQRRGMKNPRGWARHVLAARQSRGRFERSFA
jgi:superfamily II DNA or RNA helicase